MRQTPKRKKSIILRLLLIALSCYMVVMLVNEGNELSALKAEETKLKDYKETLELTNAELKELLDSDSHAAIIEKAAREKLGFVFQNEEIYIDISGN